MASTQELLSNPASVGVWNVDPGRSTIAFKAKSMWASRPSRATSQSSAVTAKSQTRKRFSDALISSRIRGHQDPQRDDHLRSADFFEAEKFPDISVVVTSAEGIDGDIVDLRAQLTVKGTTAPFRCRPRSRCSTTARCE